MRTFGMKRSKFSEEQVVVILHEQRAGARVAEICDRHGISQGTFFNWKAKYGGLAADGIRRLKALEAENAKLKTLLAEAILNNTRASEGIAEDLYRPRTECKDERGTGFDM
jgi:putative transposase